MGLIPSSPLGLKIALNDLGKGRPKKLEACEADFFVELKRAEWNSLHVMDADGRNLQRFVTSPEYVWQGSPAWSCDGTRLGFDAWRSIYGANLCRCPHLHLQGGWQGTQRHRRGRHAKLVAGRQADRLLQL